MHQSEANFVKQFFISILQFERLLEIWDICIAVSLICRPGQYVCLQLQYTNGLDL